MDLPTQTHLKALRELLGYRLSELRAAVHAAESQRRESSGAGVGEVEDFKDEASQQQLAEIDELQAQREREELAQAEAALRRLDAGTYGDCADCGAPIALQRLLAQPAAQRCATCQTAIENAARRAHGSH